MRAGGIHRRTSLPIFSHASIISIEGDSYRRRVAEESRAERKAKKG